MVKFIERNGKTVVLLQKGDICHICGGEMLKCDCGWTNNTTFEENCVLDTL